MVDCVFFGYLTSILVSREESPGQRKVKQKDRRKKASKNESGSDERRTAPQGG